MRVLQKAHKWIGLVATIFIILFALSGIFLNHRKAIAKYDVSRSLLPSQYRYNNWNNAAIKGGFELSSDSILIFGGSGIWLTDSLFNIALPYTEGISEGADNKNTLNIVGTKSGDVFATTTFDVYKLDRIHNRWVPLTHLVDTDERLADIAVKEDTIVVISRSNAFTSAPPFSSFDKTELPPPLNHTNKVSLYRTIRSLHSGELFGIAGKIFVDFIGILSIILSLTGIVILFLPRLIRRSKTRTRKIILARFTKNNLAWHNKIGAWFFVFSLIVILSGIFMRPPAMIMVIKGKIKPLPVTTQSGSNVWQDKLRSIRYDKQHDDWLIYTSDGFFSTPTINSTPLAIKAPPQVSVMGTSVLEQLPDNNWVVGSFSGLHQWNRNSGKSTSVLNSQSLYLNGDVVEQEIVKSQKGVIGEIDVSGYINVENKEYVFSYSKGILPIGEPNNFVAMPKEIRNSNISLWHLALETHSSRIYTPIVRGVVSESLFITFAGLFILAIYVTGYIMYKRKRRKRGK